jgi:hypothetical protein
MSGFEGDKRHRVTFEIRGPKTRKEVKTYMKRIRTVLRSLPGTIDSQSVLRAKAKRKTRKRKPTKRRRRTS